SGAEREPGEQHRAEDDLRRPRVNVALEQQPRDEREQDPRNEERRAQGNEAAALGLPVVSRQLERALSGLARPEPVERDQWHDEQRREAPGDLGRLSDPAQAPEALDERKRKGDEQGVGRPASN